MTDFSKPIQSLNGYSAKVLATDGDWLWIKYDGVPSTYSHSRAETLFINVPEPRVIWLLIRLDGLATCFSHRPAIHADYIRALYKVTHIDGHPPQIEEVQP